MKKIKLLLSLFIPFLFAQSLQAQLENRFSIGPRAGVNFANVNQDAETKTGLVVGITSTYSINEKSGITVDALYSGRGYGNNIDLNYFSIPILYDAFFGDLGDSFRPKIYAGIAPAFLIKASSGNSDVTTAYRGTTLDFVAGGGFNYRLANRIWLNADLRALSGITDLTEATDGLRNRTIQVSLGVAYGL